MAVHRRSRYCLRLRLLRRRRMRFQLAHPALFSPLPWSGRTPSREGKEERPRRRLPRRGEAATRESMAPSSPVCPPPFSGSNGVEGMREGAASGRLSLALPPSGRVGEVEVEEAGLAPPFPLSPRGRRKERGKGSGGPVVEEEEGGGGEEKWRRRRGLAPPGRRKEKKASSGRKRRWKTRADGRGSKPLAGG